ncbi:MAG: YfcC family protein, partial [Deltaproteobacteria bacterium]|nr:YfcC family protein [Deltaproteobacteria bacterium]
MLKKVPDVFVIVFALIVVAAVLTWILPGGSFERTKEVVEGHERELVVQGSFEYEESNPQLLQVFTAPLAGFIKLGEIVIFIFLVGGAFFILNETGAIAAGTHKLVRALKGREFLIIPIVMTLFSFLGAVFGMCEEAMPFAL